MKDRRARNLAAFLVVTLIWGSTWLVIKDQVSVVPPAWTVCWRFTVAAAGMFALAFKRGDPLTLPRRTLVLAAVLGLLQFSANFQLLYRAEIALTSGVVAVIYALLLVPNAILGRIFLGRTTGWRFVAGSAVAICGIALLLVHELRAAPVGSRVLAGAAMTIAGLICASSANILQATKALRSVPMLPLLAWAMAIGAGADAVFASLTVGAPVIDPRWHYLAGVLYLGLAGSVATFPLYFGLIRDWGPGRAAYNGVAVPVVAMTLSTVFEGYRWTALAAAGSALALVGLLLALSRPKTAASPST